MITKQGTTTVKYSKDGVEQAKDVEYKAVLAATEETKDGEKVYTASSIQDAMAVAKTKLNEEELKDADLNASKLIVSYFNQVMEQNARQAARAAFLNVASPEKAIAQIVKRVAALQGITEEAAAVLVKQLGIGG